MWTRFEQKTRETCNVPIGGGSRKPRPMPTLVAKPAVSCTAVGGAPSLGLGIDLGMAMGAGLGP